MNDPYERIAGHPILDFVNTVCGARNLTSQETLNRYRDVVDWARESNMITLDESAKLSHQTNILENNFAYELDEIITLRETFAAMLATLSEQPAKPVNFPAIWPLLHHHTSNAVLSRNSENQLFLAVPLENTGAGVILSRIATEILKFILTEDIRRIRMCHSPTCTWFFLDTTKNKSRRYCSPKTCGNRERIRKFRQKKHPA